VLPNPESWIALAAFLGSGYVVAQALRARPSSWLLGSYLGALIVAYVVLRQYPVFGWLTYVGPIFNQPFALNVGNLLHLVRILGISCMFFRQIHVLVDAAQCQIERLSLWSYLNYQLSLFTIIFGPIQRFQDFDEQWQTLDPVLADPYELLTNCLRLLWGVAKIALIAPLFYKGWNELVVPLAAGHYAGGKAIVYFAVVFYFFPIYLYCNFAGYCDIVIAANRFFGMRLPENFNRPWLARNVLDFWNRWHITLGTWIRDYLFMPMYKPVVERWPKRAAGVAWVFYIFAFLAAGAWHGTTANFIIYGALQGVGAAAAKIWENRVVAARGRAGLKEYMKSGWVRLIAILANFHFQCFTLLFFALPDWRDSWQVICAAAKAMTGHGS
jgi:D-alanyl-lipoteichoic acid acyltransferase DltB (MBOAT superfamily)